MSNEQIKYMVDRFLQWKLPENFNPDGGISFKRVFNEKTPWPMRNEPVGTNLLDATQAEEMVRYLLDGLPEQTEAAAPAPAAPLDVCPYCGFPVANYDHSVCLAHLTAELDEARKSRDTYWLQFRDAVIELEQVKAARDRAKEPSTL